MINQNDTNNEKDCDFKKKSIDVYPGLVSAHFGYVAKYVDNWFKSKNIFLTHEFWFLFSLTIFILIEKFLPGLSNYSLLSIILLLTINISITTIPFIKKRFFKSYDNKLKEIYDSNEQKSLDLFDKYMNNSGYLKLEDLNFLFKKKFANNYRAYLILFKKIIMFNSEEIKWFINNDIFKKKLFDEYLIVLFIDKTPSDISYDLYEKLKEKLKKLNLSKKTIKLFNNKFIRYTIHRTWFKNSVIRLNKLVILFKQFIVIGFICFMAIIYFLSLTSIIFTTTNGVFDKLINDISSIAAIYLLIVLISLVFFVFIRYIISFFIKSSFN